MMSRFWCRSIQSPATSLANSALSSPRGAFMSTSSTTAFWRRLANFKRRHEPLVLALDRLAIDQQREPLLEGERGNVGLLALLLERLGHAGEPERDQALLGGMCEHCFLSFLRPPDCSIPGSGSSVVVATAADVAVPDRRGVRRRFSCVGFVEPVLQDRGDRAVGGGADVVAAPAGGLDAGRAVALAPAAGCRGRSGSPARDAASPS